MGGGVFGILHHEILIAAFVNFTSGWTEAMWQFFGTKTVVEGINLSQQWTLPQFATLLFK